MKITLEGKVVVTTEGRKRSVRTFLTPEQAKVQYDKLVAEHALEQKAARRIKLTDPRHPELEQAIIDAPDDPSAFAVYADWLQSQNDPRGTLIVTMLAPNPDSLENRKAIDREFKKHPAYYYGDLVRYALDWKFGFIHSVRLTDERISPEGLGRVLAHPSGRFVTSLDIGDYPVRDAQPVIDELVRLAPPTLRSLSLYAQPGVDLTRLWATFPKLRSLTLHTPDCRVGELATPELESLRLHNHAIAAEEIATVTHASWPRLKKLELVDPSPSFIEGLVGLLERAPSLEHLEITFMPDPGELLRVLPELRVAAQLVSLWIESSELTDAHVIELARHRDRFPRLARTKLESHLFTSAGRDAIRAFPAGPDPRLH